MSKGARLRKKRDKAQRASQVVKNRLQNINTDMISVGDLEIGGKYWATGYYWSHDLVLVEPFLITVGGLGLQVLNLGRNDIQYYDALKLIKGEGTVYFYEDPVTAMEAIEAIENRNTLFSGFAEFMSDEELVKMVNM